MAEPKGTAGVQVVVDLALAEASVLARAAVVVTSSLDCKELNAAEHGLRVFRAAVQLALRKRLVVVERSEPARRAG